MKAALLVVLAMTSLPISSMKFLVESGEVASQAKVECYDYLEKALHTSIEISRRCYNKEFSQVFELTGLLMDQLVQTSKCFNHRQFQEDRKECMIRHLKAAIDLAKDGFKALFEGNFNAFVEHIQKAVDEVNEMKSC